MLFNDHIIWTINMYQFSYNRHLQGRYIDIDIHIYVYKTLAGYLWIYISTKQFHTRVLGGLISPYL